MRIVAEIASLREQMGTGGDRHEHVFLSDMSLLQWVPGSVYVCLNCKGFSQKESIAFEEQESWTTFDYVRFDHM